MKTSQDIHLLSSNWISGSTISSLLIPQYSLPDNEGPESVHGVDESDDDAHGPHGQPAVHVPDRGDSHVIVRA